MYYLFVRSSHRFDKQKAPSIQPGALKLCRDFILMIIRELSPDSPAEDRLEDADPNQYGAAYRNACR